MEGFIDSYAVDENNAYHILVKLKYFNDKPVIEKMARVSKPGIRIYKDVSSLPRILGGLGVAVIQPQRFVV